MNNKKRSLMTVGLIVVTSACGTVPDALDQTDEANRASSSAGANYKISEQTFKLNAGGVCYTGEDVLCLFDESLTSPNETPSLEVDTTSEAAVTSHVQSVPPNKKDAGCWITGGGTFGRGNTRDSFGGNAMGMKRGDVRGHWNHVDHGSAGNKETHFSGNVTYIACKRFDALPGPQVPKAEPNYANFGGTGRYNGKDGYWFDVKLFDHDEGGIFRDRYVIDIYDAANQLVLHADGSVTKDALSHQVCEFDAAAVGELSWVQSMGCLSGGNLQIHPPNAGHPSVN